MRPQRLEAGRPRAALGALVGLIALAAGCGGTVPAPREFVAFTSKDGRFTCDFPKGWETTGGGNSDVSWGKAVNGNAEIKVYTDLAGSLIGDIARAGSGGMTGEPTPEMAPVGQAHTHGLRAAKEEYNTYKERDPKVIKARQGEGRRSTFVADPILGSQVYGYRATFLGGDRRITVTCRCPASNWQALKPAFEKVIESVR